MSKPLRRMSTLNGIAVEPWEQIQWNPETLHDIYRDWGVFYTHKQQLKTAAKYYEKSLELMADDPKTLYELSKCKREIAEPESALKDTATALKYVKQSSPIDLEYCDALYEMNEFEKCKLELLNKSKKFYGSKVQAFQDRLNVLDGNFKDCVGDSLDSFLRKNEKHLAAIMEEVQQQRNPETRPLWKILQENKKCDVLSLLDIEEVFLSPREIARRQRAFRVLNQIYFNTSWIDVLFLKQMRHDPNLMLPQSFHSTPILKQTTHSKYEIVKKFLKMLQSRSPLYNELTQKFPNKKLREEHREAYLNRVQYQTRRNVLSTLRCVRLLRQMGELERLTKYVEEVMGDYIVLKTHRVLPWKYELVHEVYNILALAHTDKYVVPVGLIKHKPNDRLMVLLRLPINKTKEPKEFVFGARSLHEEAEAFEQANASYRKYITRLEKRLRFAKYSIERSYLLHEIARTHLASSHFDECNLNARKAVEEARKCNSNIWEFLSTMLIFKSYSSLNKIENSKGLLNYLKPIARRLNNPDIIAFIDMCVELNEEEINTKKRNLSFQSLKSRRSKYSFGSSYSSINSMQSIRSKRSEMERSSLNLSPKRLSPVHKTVLGRPGEKFETVYLDQ